MKDIGNASVINCGYETVVRLALRNVFYVFSLLEAKSKVGHGVSGED